MIIIVARIRSAKVTEVKERIRTRLQSGIHRPGERFLSTREVAAQFEISYQTAHRILDELCTEGWLERRAASGTFVAGRSYTLEGVTLLWNERAKRTQSFGARLLDGIMRRLERDRIPFRILWSNGNTNIEDIRLPTKYFPVIWEYPQAVDECARQRRTCLLLNDRPRPGLQAAFCDSVSIDDFSGGVCAAQMLLQSTLRGAPMGVLSQFRFCVVTGPGTDARSNARRDGFLSIIPNAQVVPAGSWFVEDGFAVAPKALIYGKDGIFCCNDRLAQAILLHCREHKVLCSRLIGFDDAPIAEALNLTTIAVPWEEMITGAVELMKRRINGDSSAAHQLIVTPRPVVRKL